VQAIGITKTESEECIALPYGPTAKTGLRERSFALCTWLIDITPDKFEIGSGFVKPELVVKIVEKMRQLNPKMQTFHGDAGPATSNCNS
jgi:hypothetical protein